MSLLVDWQIEGMSNKDKCRLYSVEVAGHQYAPTEPLLEPYSCPVQDDVISYGTTHAGYDFRLGRKAKIFKNTFNEIISPKRMKEDPSYQNRIFDFVGFNPGEELKDGEAIIVPPNGYILGYTLEYIRMPIFLSGTCVGKSTYARCGIVINTTPLEPGWEGHLTLEIANVSPSPVEIYVGEGIAQVRFEVLNSIPSKGYGDKSGKYQHQGAEPVAAKVKR